MMGGSLQVASESGQGSCFYFSLPFEVKDAISGRDMSLLQAMPLLVIDQRQEILQAFKHMLSDRGFMIEISHSVEQALQKITLACEQDRPYGLIIFDWQASHVSSGKFIAEVRHMERLYELPPCRLILLTRPLLKEHVLQQVEHMPAVHVLEKPVLFSDLQPFFESLEHLSSELQLSPELDFSGYKVLLVEDNPTNQLIAKAMLETFGLEIYLAQDGRQALEMLMQYRFDLIFMDLQMPHMGGVEATERLRQLPGYQDMPVIAMTAAVMEEDRRACDQAGMNDFVSKPIVQQDLAGVLQRWLPAGTTSRPSVEHSLIARSKEVSLPGFDMPTLLRLGNGWEFIQPLLQRFADDFADTAEKLRLWLSRGDWKSAQHRVHTIKGVAGSLGAKQLFQQAVLLDIGLKQRQLDDDVLQAFIDEMQRVLAAIPGLAADNPPLVVSGDYNHQLLEVCQQLLQAIEHKTFIVPELMQRLESLLESPEHKALFQELKQQIEEINYKAALPLLLALAESLQLPLRS